MGLSFWGFSFVSFGLVRLGFLLGSGSFLPALLKRLGKGIVLLLEHRGLLDLDLKSRVHSGLDPDHVDVVPSCQNVDHLREL